MAQHWAEYHYDPRKSYYLFMRRIYGYPALEAWNYAKTRLPAEPVKVIRPFAEVFADLIAQYRGGA